MNKELHPRVRFLIQHLCNQIHKAAPPQLVGDYIFFPQRALAAGKYKDLVPCKIARQKKSGMKLFLKI